MLQDGAQTCTGKLKARMAYGRVYQNKLEFSTKLHLSYTNNKLEFSTKLHLSYIQIIACVCVYVGVCTHIQVKVCFDCVLVLCFVLGFVLQSGEIAHKRVYCYYYYYIRGCDIVLLSPQFCVTCIRPVL